MEQQDKKVRIFFLQKYQKEDKRLQEEQNNILRWNTRLTIWATIFGGLAMLFQFIQIIVDIILVKFSR